VNGYLLVAGIVCLLMAAGHTTIGLRWVLPRLPEASLPHSPFGGGDMTAAFLTVSWHVVGITLLTFAVILSVLAHGVLGDAGTVSVRGIGLIFATTALMVLWLARRRPADLLRAPMWVLFVAVAGLCWVGGSG
jgi:hypothetical protein